MVFIPWQEMGICRYWMLQRCYSGSRCKFEHPEPEERTRLWNHYTRKQKEDEAKGILPPVNPLARPTTGAKGAARPRSPSPPPPPPVPPNSPRTRQRLQAQAEWARSQNWRERSPREQTEPLEREFRIKGRAAERSQTQPRQQPSEIFVPDATPSPRVRDPNLSSSGTKGNKEPLRKPNRLLSSKSGERTPSAPLSQPASLEKSEHAKSGKKREMSPAAQPAISAKKTRWDVEPEPKKLTAAEGLLHLSKGLDVPGINAFTVWKRGEGDSSGDIQMTATNEPTTCTSNYWKDRKASINKNEVEAGQAPAKQKVSGAEISDADLISEAPGLDLTQIEHGTPNISSSSLNSPPSVGVPPNMGAVKRLSNGESKHVGPHPSTIRVSAPYISQAVVSKKLQQVNSQGQLDIQERSIAEAREDNIRLQGVRWLDDVRRALQLPIRTFTTACVYYHKFRLAHAGNISGQDYSNAWPDVCAASLLTSCKVEDTLKKSRDILATAYNLKASAHDQLGADDSVFEGPSRVVIGLERMVLEAGGFDFRSKYPHQLMMKIAKSLPAGKDGANKKLATTAFAVLTDLYRTFAPLKQTSATMSIASLELAANLMASTSPDDASAMRDAVAQLDLNKWSTSREEIMETLLDLLDLYTQHTGQTILGTKYSLDDFLRIRLALNKECNESNIQRHTTAPPSDRAANGSTLRVANGHPTPVSPMEPGPQAPPQNQSATSNQNASEAGGTLRFVLNPELAADEKTQVQKYFVEEWEEYEEEIEIPQPHLPSREREPERERDRSRVSSERPRDAAAPRSDRGRERSRVRSREHRDRARDKDRERDRDGGDRDRRDRERERDRDRDRDRRGREDDRRYDRDRDRRYDRRYYDDDRRRDRR